MLNRIRVGCSYCDKVVEGHPEVLREQGWARIHRDFDAYRCPPCNIEFLNNRLRDLEERVDHLSAPFSALRIT